MTKQYCYVLKRKKYCNPYQMFKILLFHEVCKRAAFKLNYLYELIFREIFDKTIIYLTNVNDQVPGDNNDNTSLYLFIKSIN